MKYVVRPLIDNFVCDSVFETKSFPKAIEKVEEKFNETQTRCVIVTYKDDRSNIKSNCKIF